MTLGGMTGLFILAVLATVLNATTEHPLRKDEYDADNTDPYSGLTVERHFFNKTELDKCHLNVANKSASSFQKLLEIFQPNFIHFKMGFDQNTTIKSYTEESIFPFHWVWTYYSPNGFFPYLKWPVDFSILSFGLLDVKTLPRGKEKTVYLDIEAEGECGLVMGERNTTALLGFALRDMTQKFLLHLDPTEFSFTYWCFLEEVSGAKSTLAYQLGVYIGYPVQFAAYRCCRTSQPKYETTTMFVECLSHQVNHMFQVTVIPYIISVIAFAYFPIILLSYNTPKLSSGSYRHIDCENRTDDEIREGSDDEWVYLDGKPPLSLCGLIFEFYGLEKYHPVTMSRARRFIFVVLGPCILFVQLYVYYHFQYEMTMELLKHDTPMGYLSMLGGFEKSRYNFQPFLGGPYVLLLFYYVAGVLFLVLPRDLDRIMYIGSERSSNKGDISPLFLNEKTIEELSGQNLQQGAGYAKAMAVCKGGFFMLTNPSFWSKSVKIISNRYVSMFSQCLCMRESCVAKTLVILLCAPVLVVVSIVELFLCVLYYGVPVVTVIIMASKGYRKVILDAVIHDGNDDHLFQSNVWIRLCRHRIIRYTLAAIIFCFFVYFVFSFCTIFTASLSFVSKILVFSFVSIIVYPSYSFGYLFFGVAILYYIFKLLTSFGEGYLELLTDAVETSLHMEEPFMHASVFSGTVFLPRTNGLDISRLQIHDHVINLSTEQRKQIKEFQSSRFQKIKERKQTVGIPRNLFDYLVRKFRPVHIQVAQSIMWLTIVLTLIGITISIIQVQPFSPLEGISEIMHVLFIMIVGALPEMIGMILDRSDHMIKKEIKIKKVKAAIHEYWNEKESQMMNHWVGHP